MGGKILITGAGGYIGRHVVDAAIETGAQVVACDIKPDGIGKRAKIVDLDILSGEKDLFHQFGEPDICIHMAWKDGFSHNAESHMEHLSDHFVFLRNMIDAGIKQVVVMGSMHEVGYHEGAIDEGTPCNPSNLYAIAKDALRRSIFLTARDKDVIVQWLRVYYIYGDDMYNQSIFTKLLKAVQEGKKTFPFTSGKNKYDFIHVSDLARQIVAIAMQTQITGTINCCSGEPVTLGDKVEEFIKEHGLDIKLEYGAFPDREYDSPAIWGAGEKISQIMEKRQAQGG